MEEYKKSQRGSAPFLASRWWWREMRWRQRVRMRAKSRRRVRMGMKMKLVLERPGG
ncbi:hypothetical protein RHGRI_001705 [Rhododendron griersonianum]|uniref:Uncharacterized protein n=1 Tax=Rhododendron griersonianum TaxID=479676 RepID=A0AAV6LMG5_9ERIC|nr:hypothetical protein RHGRI_001705 [Rhododendron griersonianum]